MVTSAFHEYVKAVRRTANSPLAALALGLAGEYFEWAESGFTDADEHGDLLWYAVAIVAHFGWEDDADMLSSMCTVSTYYDTNFIGTHVGKVCELVKKHIAHGQNIQEDQTRTKAMRKSLALLVRQLWQTDIVNANVNKLTRRWPNGFGVSEKK